MVVRPEFEVSSHGYKSHERISFRSWCQLFSWKRDKKHFSRGAFHLHPRLPLVSILFDEVKKVKRRIGSTWLAKAGCRQIFAAALLSVVVLLPQAVAAQNPQLYVYPLKGQNTEQQDRDRYECHSWAVQQTGYDPSRAYPSNPNYLDPQPYRPSQPHVLRGAGRGAALGAVGGAITGDAGKGAAAGAAMGGLAGGFRRRDERRQQAAQQQANAASAVASQHMNYTRAMAACLEGRGYSVK